MMWMREKKSTPRYRFPSVTELEFRVVRKKSVDTTNALKRTCGTHTD